MNQDDITSAVSVTKDVAETLHLSDVVKAFFGDAAHELGQTLTDRVRLYRYGRSLKMLKKAEKMVKDAGLTPKAVPIKLLLPLLDGASLEENEELHTMWAALLANAATSENANTVEASFIAILKQMSPEEAQLLSWFRHSGRPEFEMLSTSIVLEYLVSNKMSVDQSNSVAVLRWFDGLESYQLVRQVYFQIASTDPLPSRPTMTERGYAFLAACEPPKP